MCLLCRNGNSIEDIITCASHVWLRLRFTSWILILILIFKAIAPWFNFFIRYLPWWHHCFLKCVRHANSVANRKLLVFLDSHSSPQSKLSVLLKRKYLINTYTWLCNITFKIFMAGFRIIMSKDIWACRLWYSGITFPEVLPKIAFGILKDPEVLYCWIETENGHHRLCWECTSTHAINTGKRCELNRKYMCVCSNANPLHYYMLWVPCTVDRWR